MEIIDTPLLDCKIIKTPVHGDDRGFFMESFNQRKLADSGLDFDVKQINFAQSQKNVLRGLHFQTGVAAQAKLVGVMQGAVLDVVVDIRPKSKTFGAHFTLKIENRDTLLFIPKGFAHGYLTLNDHTLFYYAVDNFYNPDHEGGLLYNDTKLDINWSLNQLPLLSQKDLNHLPFDQQNFE